MWKVLALAAVALAVLVAAVPAAATQRERTGARINIFTGPSTFAAGAPFHIAHGWFIQPDFSDHDAVGKWSFALDVDGVRREVSFVERVSLTSDETGFPFDILSRFWVHNFPDGMPAGTNTFTGHWYGPCQSALESGFPVGPCEKVNEVVEANRLSRTVTFTP